MFFGGFFQDKRVLVTGHTGFKGTWLTTWLLKLGANVCGISDKILTTPSMFEQLGLAERIEHHFCDITDLATTTAIIEAFKPDVVFHLAAQAIVSMSYEDPVTTIRTNVLGTTHILEALRSLENPCVGIVITSDKCYENVEWEWGYRESDSLGGKDIYSASKAAAEMVFGAYCRSFYQAENAPIRLASARAGNVIGGGDWSKDRIVVDCIKAWCKNGAVEIRCPESTRPWQHVLEPLSGYLTLAWKLGENQNLHGHSFNFGPLAEQNHTVIQLLKDLSSHCNFGDESNRYQITNQSPFNEASLLKLNCDKALMYLKWHSNLEYAECIKLVGDWYSDNLKNNDMFKTTVSQLDFYEKRAVERTQLWAQTSL